MYNLKQITKITNKVRLYSNQQDELIIMCPLDMSGTTSVAKDDVYNATEVLKPITNLIAYRNYKMDVFTKDAELYLDKVTAAIDTAINYYRENEQVKDWRDFIK